MRRVSRNHFSTAVRAEIHVTPRMRRVSRNEKAEERAEMLLPVTPRMRRVSRNVLKSVQNAVTTGHASHEACE